MLALDFGPEGDGFEDLGHDKGTQEGEDDDPEEDKVQIGPCFGVESGEGVLVLEVEEFGGQRELKEIVGDEDGGDESEWDIYDMGRRTNKMTFRVQDRREDLTG